MKRVIRSKALLAFNGQRVAAFCARSKSQPLPYDGSSTAALRRCGAPRTYAETQWRSASFAQKATDLNQKGIDQELNEYDQNVAEEKEKQRKAPWHREGAQDPPVRRQRDAGAMTKG